MNSSVGQIMGVVVRSAVISDAPEIANVHLNSWREAYRDLLPKDYLDRLPLTFRRRMNWWSKAISEPEKFAVFVAESESGLVGFSCFAPARLSSMSGYGEIEAIYLLERYKGKKIGATLLGFGMNKLIDWGYEKAYCWVLADNPTIQFYEHSGAVFTGIEKDDEIGGKKVKELMYEWKSLARFLDPRSDDR